ncbi:unnamed protein product [Nezara viridula]|uniref:Uncharacterized protein n=1 Tax=Nezara viridula TaxID=85310 RepID=A0A9P0HF17_NEZVI|nr:unnamed protein product [Nezara viridula]
MILCTTSFNAFPTKYNIKSNRSVKSRKCYLI